MTGLIYTKEGRSRRLELERGAAWEIALEERGQAIEREGLFESTTLPGETSVDPSAIAPIPQRLIDTLAGMKDGLERATVITGAAHHRVRSHDQDRTWRDAAVRLHASIVSRATRLRCEVDRGGTRFEETWISQLLAIRDNLERCRTDRGVTGPVCLEPSVSAAIIASVWTSGMGNRIGLAQIPRAGELDGYGRAVEEHRMELPHVPDSWFRPSYRTRPRPKPHGIDLAGDPSGSETPRISAISLAGAVRLEREHLLVPCLFQGDDGATAATLEIDLRRWDEQIHAVSDRAEWIPLLAGVWGRRLVFRGRISPLSP
ncbi:MAG: hypothetical protein KY432_11875 [Acidobacteria bacterium]|nr:hypothetical protein [Acidobacteriota bacterium]